MSIFSFDAAWLSFNGNGDSDDNGDGMGNGLTSH